MAEKLPIISFGKLGEGMPMPHLLDIQTQAFQTLLTPEGEGHSRTSASTGSSATCSRSRT